MNNNSWQPELAQPVHRGTNAHLRSDIWHPGIKTHWSAFSLPGKAGKGIHLCMSSEEKSIHRWTRCTLPKRRTWDSLNYGHKPRSFQVSGLWHIYRAMSARCKKESEEIMTMKALNCCGCCLAKCFRSENIWNWLRQGIGKWSSIWMNQLLHPWALIEAMAYFRDLSFVM